MTYLGEPAIAIFFQNMTKHVDQIRLESDLLKEQNRVETLQSFTSTISHEFSTPLNTCIMLLETLVLKDIIDAKMQKTLNMIITQLNLLVSLTNDVIDMNSIKQGTYQPKLKCFSPVNVFNFIVKVFQTQSKA